MVIYEIKNKVNGKRYVGSTWYPNRRKTNHLNMLARNKHHSYLLQRAYNKYGKESFEFNILETVSTKEKLYKLEQTYINQLEPEYNVAKVVRGFVEASPEGKKKQADAAKKIVLQYTKDFILIKEWESATEAAKYFTVTPEAISGCARGKVKFCKGFAFRYKNSSYLYAPKRKRLTLDELRISNTNRSKVHEKEYQIIDATGSYQIKNLASFCRDKKLPYHYVMKCIRNNTVYKGYNIKRLDKRD